MLNLLRLLLAIVGYSFALACFLRLVMGAVNWMIRRNRGDGDVRPTPPPYHGFGIKSSFDSACCEDYRPPRLAEMSSRMLEAERRMMQIEKDEFPQTYIEVRHEHE